MSNVIAGLYARVSTMEQTTANQLDELRKVAEAHRWTPQLYEEQESAAKVRPVLEQLLADVRVGRVRAVVVWALDRLHRSMVGAVQTVLELDRLGVQLVSVREPWLDTSGPVRPLLVAIFGWVAEQERARLIERTRAGLERAKAKGTRSGRPIGRPRASPVMLHAAADLVSPQVSIREAARKTGVREATLRRFLATRKAPAEAAGPAPTG